MLSIDGLQNNMEKVRCQSPLIIIENIAYIKKPIEITAQYSSGHHRDSKAKSINASKIGCETRPFELAVNFPVKARSMI